MGLAHELVNKDKFNSLLHYSITRIMFAIGTYKSVNKNILNIYLKEEVCVLLWPADKLTIKHIPNDILTIKELLSIKKYIKDLLKRLSIVVYDNSNRVYFKSKIVSKEGSKGIWLKLEKDDTKNNKGDISFLNGKKLYDDFKISFLVPKDKNDTK